MAHASDVLWRHIQHGSIICMVDFGGGCTTPTISDLGAELLAVKQKSTHGSEVIYMGGDCLRRGVYAEVCLDEQDNMVEACIMAMGQLETLHV